ncbi:hypothetical protein SKAU_G00054570 [Synaphobranchus kaupii]|uniref:Uncharacterized protein n=1 Tax=Synaphobranchus kaupii TaxID=118154 RepID=A0A9Q1G4R1_SYNKA|nr:hypothetical protein SKAU_G00054570 [Synaphobranchus kaupii]
MSSLSNQQPAGPFSEYSELCKVPSMPGSQKPQGWEWQHGEMGAPRSLGGPPRATGLTDEDKLCFFEGPAGVGVDSELKPPCCPPRPPDISTMPDPRKAADTSVWNPSFAGPPVPGPKPAAQAAPNYCVIGVVNDNYLEGGDATLGGPQLAGGSSEDSEDEMEPCFMGRAEQQRKAMRRAMSECSHLSVPASLELPDKYPDKFGALDELPSPGGGPRRPHSAMKRSLTVADEQPPTPPPTLSAGASKADLRQGAEPGPRLSPFPPPQKDGGSFPLSSLEGILEVTGQGKEQSVLIPVPVANRAFTGAGGTNPFSVAEGRSRHLYPPLQAPPDLMPRSETAQNVRRLRSRDQAVPTQIITSDRQTGAHSRTVWNATLSSPSPMRDLRCVFHTRPSNVYIIPPGQQWRETGKMLGAAI